ncbi:unknown protein [Oryza sativa Japonica Group]|uniref:Uncharacterized protein OJ1656_A11.3-2 n=2 Tax=Oryza sativa subsp. japonica TaxID=39947 RepID=Q5JLF2_ORYSJ|nr:hypothetical protein DAI22_01g486900 [Oryza sativa Japonica Group]BAD87695.1 unknown protein [Oryza sativa Japonica Group]
MASSGEKLQKHRPEEIALRTGSSGQTTQKLREKAATENHRPKEIGPSGEKPPHKLLRAKGKAGTSSIGVTLQKHRAEKADSSRGIPHKLQAPAGTSSIGVMPQKYQAKQQMGTSRLGRHPPCIQVQGGVSNREAQAATTNRQKHTKSNNSLSTRATTKLRSATNTPCQKPTTAPSSNGNTAPPKDRKEPATNAENNAVPVAENNDLQEADEAIKRLNELGLGENISSEEFLTYIDQLNEQPKIDTSIELDDAQVTTLYFQHARYRVRYYKHLSQQPNTELVEDSYHMKLVGEDELSDEFIREMEFFMRFEEDGTFDWYFYPDYCWLAALNDYQRLVPINCVGEEYAYWDDYRGYFNSYHTELQYLDFCKALSKELKWMEDYVLNKLPSSKWGRICSRGAYQAIKIATRFSKITAALAYNAYYHMRFYVAYCKDMDSLYFEIWQRVNMQKKSFRDSLEEVYNLNKFPSRQDKMKDALENNCSHMETVFHVCTASVTSEIAEDKALELIAKAVESRMNKAKFYEQYIEKKIDIAQAIGLISTDGTEAT